MSLPIKSEKPPSELFDNLVATTDSPVETCEFCGRTCFEDEPNLEWEPGEYESLKQSNKTDPDKYYAMTHVACGTMNGKSGVIGCPCNWGYPFEHFIWSHRRFIMEYISARVRKIVERALEDEGAAEEATADIETAEKAKSTVRCEKCFRFVSEIAVNEKGICVKCVEQEDLNKLAMPKDEVDDDGDLVNFPPSFDPEENNLPF